MLGAAQHFFDLPLQPAAAEAVPVGAEQTGETKQQCYPGESAL